jgi:DeoR family transcriptional regulator, aga operon transcriptional repressor
MPRNSPQIALDNPGGHQRKLLFETNRNIMPSNGLLNEERRREILGILHRDGRVLVKDLAPHFRISQITIRKDLEFLDHQGVIQRTHGGALPVQAGALLDPTLREKEKLHRKQKTHIALAAARLVDEGQSVLLDSGTTTTAIARALRDMAHLTVITNAINIAAELAGTHVEVILTGGMLRKNSFSLVGPLAERTLRELSADILFLGVDGFDTKAGLFTPNLFESEVNRAMVEISRRTIAVCDSSKFGRRSLCNIMPVTMVHEVITDKQIPKSDLRALKEAGVKVTLV